MIIFSRIFGLARDALPVLVTATVLPLALFYAVLASGSTMAAIGTSIAYAYSLASWQWWRRRRVSAMLGVTIVLTTMRLVAALTGGPLAYFGWPIVETTGFGLVFIASLRTAQPLIVRLANDLVPSMAHLLVDRPALVRHLSWTWTAVYLSQAATTLVLLLFTPLMVFVAAHTFAGWAWVAAGVIASWRVYRRAVAPRAALLGPAVA
jgi:hypothetical protein